MRTILQINKFHHPKGGAERVLFQERRWLRENGHTVLNMAMRSPQDEPCEQAGYFVRHKDYHARQGLRQRLRLAASFVHSREAVRRVTDMVRRYRPDLAHLHNIYHQLTPSIIPALKREGIPVVLTLHDFKLVCPAYVLRTRRGRTCTACVDGGFYHALTSNCQESWFRGALLALEAGFHRLRGSYEQVDRFIAPSRFMADMAARRVNPEKITLLPNAIETRELLPAAENEAADQGYALYLGRLSHEKGVPTLLQAHQGLDLPLKIVGTGPEEAGLRARYPDAEYLGFCSGERLYSLIRHSAFVVVPSEWHENCPMVVLEAMALGRPVLASNMGGMPELVQHGVTGLLFESGNVEQLRRQMQALDHDPGLRAAMGRAARARAESAHSLDRHGRELLRIYDEVTRGGRA